MAGLSLGALVGIIFVGIFAIVLIAVGVTNIRSGQKNLVRERAAGRQVVWHRQILILFGINNIVFAGLIVLVTLLAMLSDLTAKRVIIGLLAACLVASIVLVIRCVSSVLKATQTMARPPQDKTL